MFNWTRTEVFDEYLARADERLGWTKPEIADGPLDALRQRETLERHMARANGTFSPATGFARLSMWDIGRLIDASGLVKSVRAYDPESGGQVKTLMIFDPARGYFTPAASAFAAEARRYVPGLSPANKARQSCGLTLDSSALATPHGGTRFFHLVDGVYDREEDQLLPHSPDLVFTAESSTGRAYDPSAGTANARVAFDQEGYAIAWVIGVDANPGPGAPSAFQLKALCPLCDCIHAHGAQNPERQPGHRVRHCGDGVLRMGEQDYVIHWPDDATLEALMGTEAGRRLPRMRVKKRVKDRIDTSEFTSDGTMPRAMRKRLDAQRAALR